MLAPGGTTKRALLIWGGLLALVVVAFIATVVILNATVYSASGFVRGYLGALDRGDTNSALQLAGIQPGAEDDLLAVSEEGRVRDFHTTRDVVSGGVHRVTAEFRLGRDEDGQDGKDGNDSKDSKNSQSEIRRATFAVERDGTIGGLFSGWKFTTAPTASVEVTPLHDPRFEANGVDIRAASADLATRYTVLAPAVFELTHDSTYLTAKTATVVAASPGTVARATVSVVPKASFLSKVKVDVTKYLKTTCLPQRVLLPAGCPFGEEVDDRLTSDPRWSMTTYPPVALRATATPGVWLVTRATGRAHLEVDTQSLYDGSDVPISRDVPFQVEYLVTIGSDNGLTITPR